MKIVVYGAGVMAQYVKESIINSKNEFVGFVDPLGKGDFVNLKGENSNVEYDAIIDFSHFSLIDDVLEAGIAKKVPVLVATTGHTEEQLKKIEKAAELIPVIKATNTSLGVNIVNEIVAFATKLLKDFDIEIVEKHHNRKIDAPSGTASTLLEIVKENLNDGNDYRTVYGREGYSKRAEKEIGVHAIRGGNIVGEHTVIYAKNDEIIEIKHEALSRKMFSDGAVKAIEFLSGKNAGKYTMRDVLGINK
ncbi:MAG: 4-hydroxy-tetrahydrodipicolinate reductase [Leptotrichia sp.]|uniref:4-hydroxy-tetrahydrodipicolinate reductase n=1 Tax=Leptotrichia rugosa TaxID=3239302 RepID=A0AB39VGF8_9FUSO|nr:4-hydroxy-tetrahydrodipicolinate reductase [Leptotrichia sp. oral taxon 498]ASQ48570.1 4-hydroxy-tetrahydrodipicolinate reductase [Leptotrichia sp. oral taxon 498]RKW35296.1 MAG: 4-hydroxy-tetrahydrodipicolinate reductase [Leptotrichia sp.]